jgi:hypothetical protein
VDRHQRRPCQHREGCGSSNPNHQIRRPGQRLACAGACGSCRSGAETGHGRDGRSGAGQWTALRTAAAQVRHPGWPLSVAGGWSPSVAASSRRPPRTVLARAVGVPGAGRWGPRHRRRPNATASGAAALPGSLLVGCSAAGWRHSGCRSGLVGRRVGGIACCGGDGLALSRAFRQRGGRSEACRTSKRPRRSSWPRSGWR